jgi:hypothetical protein
MFPLFTEAPDRIQALFVAKTENEDMSVASTDRGHE